MDGKIDLTVLISLIVAIVAIWKLRSVLGQRTSQDEQRIEQQMRARQERERQAAANQKVVTLPRRGAEDAGAAATAGEQAAIAQAEAKVKTFSTDPAVEQGLLAVVRADPTFDPAHFMQGAKQAYEMIVTAFAEGNRKMLRDLLSKEVMEGFNVAITERERRGEVIDQSFVGINKADIVGAELKNGVATLMVKFDSQLISATRDKSGEVISGDPQRITDVTDYWSFAREVASRNPNWKLVATESAA
jgi:predicted lipid-binding transport protein (Tim44 family)